jgi:hypothetical protein
MDPSVSDLRKILKHHEEFGQANNTSLQQLMAKLREFEEMMADSLTEWKKSLGNLRLPSLL